MKRINERYTKFFEMAKIGKVGDLYVEVYTDHNPPHFHVTRKDEFEVRLSIKDLKIISYKWQKDGKEISSKDIKAIQKWMTKNNVKDKDISNEKAIKFAWKIMNED